MFSWFGRNEPRRLVPINGDISIDTSYRLQDLSAPRLSGAALRMFAATCESGTGRSMILPKLLKDNGFIAFRETAIPEVPTLLPLHRIPHMADYRRAPTTECIAQAMAAMGESGNQKVKEDQGSFQFHSTEALAAAYRSKEVTPVHVIEAVLEASQQEGKKVNAFVAQMRDEILQQARESTERLERGEPRSILEGVPIAVKDEFHVKGYVTKGGTNINPYGMQSEDATVVARLREAGAIIIGKTVMSEIGICPVGFQQHYGPPRNPYNLGHHTGGSSSGSAVSVASGLCPVAVSADGGGSIRIPASFCGMYGIKPTYARVSEHGAIPLCQTLGHAGPIASTARDLVISYAAMQGADDHDEMSLAQPEEKFAGLSDGVSGLRIGVDRRWAHHASSEIVDALNACIAVLQKAGATVLDVVVPELEEMRCAHTNIILAEMAATVAAISSATPQVFAYDTRVKLALAGTITAVDYMHSQQMRTRAIAHVKRIFEQCDMLLTPTTGITAPQIEESALPEGLNDLIVTAATMRFAQLGNLTGIPAVTIPWTNDSKRLPIGVQFHGRPWEESTLLRTVLFLETVSPPRTSPVVYADILTRARGYASTPTTDESSGGAAAPAGSK